MNAPSSTKTTCPYCGVGCGLSITQNEDGRIRVAGDPEHPANYGRLCSKGAALADTLETHDRLLYPLIRGERASWNQALDLVATRFNQIIRAHGPDALAFYVSGQLLTEDYYVANKLMKGFIGSGNIDTNSRLCMASSVAGHKRAFGSDTVPCDYGDLECADLIVLVGSNTAWCHPVLYQRIKEARRNNPERQVVVIDPRRTATCEIADVHLPLAPGTDVLLFNGLLHWLKREDGIDWGFLEAHTQGFSAAFEAARNTAGSIPEVAAGCGLSEVQVTDFYRLFTRTDKTITLFSQGVNQWSCGTDKVNAIINCHLATGRIGKPGMGPFSITGQPNAMGGREVGGLANQLAAHMDYEPESIDRLTRFWQSPRMATKPGLKAVDLFYAIERQEIKAVWILSTNPVDSMPDADRVRAALEACELVICSDLFANTDTARYADVLLPATAWGEKDGTVTNSERRISRQRAFLPAPGEARPDWWMLTQVACRMGFEQAFAYQTPADIFREHARLSGFENQGERAFDIGEYADISESDYEGLTPLQWPATRPFMDGRFNTADGKARFLALTPRPPAIAVDQRFPLRLNTGRIRDHWHSMTRTARAAQLNSHLPEPFLQIHPKDAEAFNLTPAGLARIQSRQGQMLARVRIDQDQRPGSVFIPMHWNDSLARDARVDALVQAALDPVSGQPEFKHTPVSVEPLRVAWHGFLLSRERMDLAHACYQVAIRGHGHWRHELAGESPIDDWDAWARQHFGDQGDWLAFADPARGSYRGACLHEGRLIACLFIAPELGLPERGWLSGLFQAEAIGRDERQSLLLGRPPRGGASPGETICSCFSVGLTTIVSAIRDQQLTSCDAIGQALQAGTNCGSCLPELQRILDREGSTQGASQHR